MAVPNKASLNSSFSKKSRDSTITFENARRADVYDLEAIEALVRTETFMIFGDIEVAEVIEQSYITMCLENCDGDIVAAMSFSDHPNLPAISPSDWSDWLFSLYRVKPVTPRNTLWLHLVVWDELYTFNFVMPLLKAVFNSWNVLEYVLLLTPPGIVGLPWLNYLGTRVLPAGYSDATRVQTVYLMARQRYVTKFKIRRAVEEDNDDLVPLIHSNTEKLVQNYGEFYIAEMLTRHQDAGRQIIVADYADRATAVLCLSETVNVQDLNKNFMLLPFYGLCKPCEEDNWDELADIGSNSLDIQSTCEPEERSTYRKEMAEDEQDFISVLEEENLSTKSEQSESSKSESITLVGISSISLTGNRGESEDDAGSTGSADFTAAILSGEEYQYKMHLFADKQQTTQFLFENFVVEKLLSSTTNLAKLVFHGEINAFSLEVAVSDPEYEHETLSLLLEAAFECFPDRDYCVLTMPSTCPPVPIMKHFVKVAPKSISHYPHELYVLHRNAILSTISVREAERMDIEKIEHLVKNVDYPQDILNSFCVAVNFGDKLKAYVMLSEDEIVGMATVYEEDQYESHKNNYELSFWINENSYKLGSHGCIDYLVLSPIFLKHSRFFMREIHRLSDFSILFYYLFPPDTTTAVRQRCICCTLGFMIPVRPRIKPEFTTDDLDESAPSSVVTLQQDPFALFISTPRLLTLKRYEINRKIVVVGASDTATAFLDSLLCTPNINYRVTFNNVTLISPFGFNYQKPENKVRDMMFVTSGNYDYRMMHLIALKTYVNNINSVITEIDRKNKKLFLIDETFVSYDYLFLLCGQQFQKPESTEETKSKGKWSKFPTNVFLVNSETDASNALSKLQALISAKNKSNSNCDVIVYGHVLEVYCCMAALIEFGLSGKNITFVESFPVIDKYSTGHEVSVFNDGDVDEAVQRTIEEEEIETYRSFYFTRWTHNLRLNIVTSVCFSSRHREVNLPCTAMFMYNHKVVSPRTFLAISKAGLVFDGNLVIRPNGQTNDPSIYAAGSITKYSRRFYADHLAHRNFNGEEIGHKMGEAIRKKFVPTMDKEDEDILECPKRNINIPVFKEPLVRYCRLPGNLRYLSITKPGKKVPLEVAMSSSNYGKILVTGDCYQIHKQGYFRLHLSPLGTVETITCLAKFDIDRINLTRLWGKHEKCLNNLLLRFEMQTITDLFAFFREPWTCAIYLRRFESFEKSVHDLLTTFTIEEGNSLIEDLTNACKKQDWDRLTYEQVEDIENKFLGSWYHEKLEKKLIEYIQKNKNFLPMYAHPTWVRDLLTGLENSPLFEPQ